MFTYETDSNLRNMALAAVKAQRLRGYPAKVTLTQWAAESRWGTRTTGSYNYGGIKRTPDKGPAKLCPTTEELTLSEFASMRADERATVTRQVLLPNGKVKYWMSCWFASYASVDDYVSAYIDFILGNSRYNHAWAQYQLNHDEDGLIDGISKAGYASSSEYEQLLLTIDHQANIAHAVVMAAQDLDSTKVNVIS